MIHKFLTFLFITFVLVACNATVKEKEASQRDIEKGEEVKSGEMELGEPVDIFQLKKMPFLSTTSGVVPNEEAKNFCAPVDHQFFGQYFLLDRTDEQTGIIGRLTVSIPNGVKGWTYENEYESFVQLELTSNKLSLWNKISVGISELELKNFIAPYTSYKKGVFIYSWIGDYALTAEMDGNSVKKLIVARTCDGNN